MNTNLYQISFINRHGQPCSCQLAAETEAGALEKATAYYFKYKKARPETIEIEQVEIQEMHMPTTHLQPPANTRPWPPKQRDAIA